MKQISMQTRRFAELEARTAGPNINELDGSVRPLPIGIPHVRTHQELA
jgi:hypothetical protein